MSRLQKKFQNPFLRDVCHTNVCNIPRLFGAMSLLVFNKSLTNLAALLIFRRSFQISVKS